MLSIPHSLTGAFIASNIPQPIVYAPLSLAAHYLGDWIPHWDFGTGMNSGKRRKSTAILLEIVELVIAFALIYLFFQRGYSEIRWHVWFGALIGILPDLIDAPRNFLKLRMKFLDPIFQLHHFFHHSTPNVIFGLLPQIIVVAVIYFLR
ncbi:hypothetical protein GW926_03830 [Candidatus Pacearchaeota archaeon]|nr:hypothetical protein [Candidatus Pacearchaeota archaeon]